MTTTSERKPATSGPDTTFSQSIESSSDAHMQLFDNAAEIARESTRTYVKGLNAIADRQTSSYQALQQRTYELVETAEDLARDFTNTYVKGLNLMAEQQRLSYRSFQHWVSGVATVPSEIRQQLRESYEDARGQLARSAEDSLRIAGEALTDVGQGSTAAAGGAFEGRSSGQAESLRRTRSPRSQSQSTYAERRVAAKWPREEYESLTAAEIIAKLPQLSQHELREVETHEKAQQSRQTVLQKIASLRGQEPVPGYDELTVADIQKRLTDGDVELAARVRDYERPHKSRDGVLDAAEAQLKRA